MKKINPKYLYLMKNIIWNKPEFSLNTSIYAGFSYRNNDHQWLDKKSLMSLIKTVNSHCIFDNGMVRFYAECLVFSDSEITSLKIGDIDKKSNTEDFLSLPLNDKRIRKTKGTFDDNWLKKNWPGLPKDHKKEVYQIAPDDLRSQSPFKWGEPFQVATDFTKDTQNSSLPLRRIQLFSLSKSDEFKEIQLQPDLIWLFPDKECGIIISHGSVNVDNAQASNLTYLYLDDSALDENISLEEHQANFNEKLALKKPNFKPKPMKIKPAPIPLDKVKPQINKKPLPKDLEVEQMKEQIDQKVLQLKAQFKDEFSQQQTQKLPNELQNAINESDPKTSISKIKAYMDSKLSEIQQKLINQYPDKKESILNPPQLSSSQILANISQSLTASYLNAKLILPKEAQAQLPQPNDLIEEVTNKIKTLEEKNQPKPKVLQTVTDQIVYRDGDFSNQNLSNHDFTGFDLTNTNFSNTNLSGSKFDKTIINNTNFSNADLSQCQFSHLNLLKGNFTKTILTKSHFRKCNIKESIFNDCNGSFLISEKSLWLNCQFNQSNLSKVKLTDSSINHIKMTAVNLNFTEFDKVNFNKLNASKLAINHTRFNDVDINQSQITNFQFTESNCNKLRINLSVLEDGSCELTKFNQSSFIESTFKETSFLDANLNALKANTNTTFDHCNFTNTDLSCAKLMDLTFSYNQFHNTNFNHAMIYSSKLINQRFKQITAQGTNFYGSDLSECYFEKCNLFEAKLRASNLSSTSFVKSNLYDVSLYQANIDGTLFDDNLTKSNFNLIKVVQPIGALQ